MWVWSWIFPPWLWLQAPMINKTQLTQNISVSSISWVATCEYGIMDHMAPWWLANNCSFNSTAISDHFLICQFLKNVSKEDVQRLGGALGLSYPGLQKMNSFPDEMVAAWLNRQDKVLQHSGEPTWSALEDALRKIGQTGLAEDLKNKRIVHGASHNSSRNRARERNTSTNVKSGLFYRLTSIRHQISPTTKIWPLYTYISMK